MWAPRPASILLSGLLSHGLIGQSASLTFTGRFNGEHIPLDSILVQNLAQGGDTVLYAPDTVLLLQVMQGFHEAGTLEGSRVPYLSAHPNPFNGYTTIVVEVERASAVELVIADPAGRILAGFSGPLSAGRHDLLFRAPGPGIHLAMVTTDGLSNVLKLVHAGPVVGGPATLDHVGTDRSGVGRPKSGALAWAPADALRFTGFSTLAPDLPLSQVIEAAPTGDDLFVFNTQHGIPCLEVPFVTDIDGHAYSTVRIGDQCWFQQNLRTLHYRDGSSIPSSLNALQWSQATEGAAAAYANNATNVPTYGLLYNWSAVVDARGLCPMGWHVPTDAEWTTMTLFLGGLPVAGGKLKATGTQQDGTGLWNTPNLGATNSTGFHALPGGFRDPNGGFFTLGSYATFWSASERSTDNAWGRYLLYDFGGIDRDHDLKQSGYCVRCIRD